MEGVFRFVAKGLEMEIRGGEEFLKEVLGDRLQKILDECLVKGLFAWQPEDPAPARKETAKEETSEPVPTLAEMRSRANITNNKELVTLAIYYAEYYQKNPPNNDDLRHLLREELREKEVVLNSMTTYLQRAKKQGWIAQEGKRWRMTSTGLQKMQQLLG